MVFNVAGLLAVAEVAFRPHLLVPKLVVGDIRSLKLQALKARGVVGVVLDKDNCLTKPKHDALVPELQEAWSELINTFGRQNVLIVSNSAGTRDDAGFLQAESVSRHLGVPVLLHSTKKPGCTKAVQDYFHERLDTSNADRKGKGKAVTIDQVALDVASASIFSQETPDAPSTSGEIASSEKPPIIMIIGDRVMTDVILANRINKPRLRRATANAFQALPILTTTLWQKEGLGTRIMRFMETSAVRRASAYYTKRQAVSTLNWLDCVSLPPRSPVPAAALPPVIVKAKRPAYKYLSKEHFRHILSRSTRAMFTLFGRLFASIARRIEPIWKEARQAQFGFRLPQSYQRTKLLRDILEGQRAMTTKK